MDIPAVTIILLNWHGWRNTLACLASLERLSYGNYHVLLIDNGSTDDSVQRIRTAYPTLELIETGKNLGFAGGCNVGIRKALDDEAKYIWLLNNDTSIDPFALSAMVKVAESNQRIGAVGSVLYYMSEPKRVQAWGGGRINFWTGCSKHLTAPGRFDYLTGASLLLRSNALLDVSLFDENTFFMYWEDVDLCFRLRKREWSLVVAEQSKIWHKESGSSGKGSYLVEFYANRSAVRFFTRYYRFWIWPIVISVGVRLVKRILTGKWARARAVYSGTIKGFLRNNTELTFFD